MSDAAPPVARSAKEPDDPQTVRAREEFVSATNHVKLARWGDALAAFERSAALRPHALTTYNIGASERALGRYTRARRSLARALAQHEASGGTELPASYAEEARAYLTEIDRLLARMRVTIAPRDAALTVDGRPVERVGTPTTYVAGLASPGTGQAVPDASFDLLADPGAHVFTLSRRGFVDVVVNRTFGPGTAPELRLELDRMPAAVHIASNEPGAAVMVAGVDVGIAPVQLSRPAGRYEIAVQKPGFVGYRTAIDVRPGEQAALQANLSRETTPVYKRFWFWAVAGALVAGVAGGTYLLTRQDRERPPPDGGGLGYVVTVP
jgi:hypothetical protein